jgi:hypothetical protein
MSEVYIIIEIKDGVSVPPKLYINSGIASLEKVNVEVLYRHFSAIVGWV